MSWHFWRGHASRLLSEESNAIPSASHHLQVENLRLWKHFDLAHTQLFMLRRTVRQQHFFSSFLPRRHCLLQQRPLLTLAIETSCDDTCVAILEKDDAVSSLPVATQLERSTHLRFHDKVTAANSSYGGIHPIVSLDSHWSNLASLVEKSLSHLPNATQQTPDGQKVHLKNGDKKRKPDFISVTRGPGMRSNLVCGLDTAKGLSIAWGIPLLGVHHMQAHALTPRLVHALDSPSASPSPQPQFPFLTLLISGGHTMLLHSTSLTSHSILATTRDIAIGDCLDKCGRAILPADLRASVPDTAYGKYLSNYAFPCPSTFSSYPIPARRGDEIAKPLNQYDWAIQQPLGNTKDLSFSFGGIASYATKLSVNPSLSSEERLLLARTALGTAFEHLSSRTVLALASLSHPTHKHSTSLSVSPVSTLVVSGGVAANPFLRFFLRSFLDVRGFKDIKLVFPPVWLCTDNAAMIAWAGMEMYEAGWRSKLSCGPVRKWSMDDSERNEEAGEGGGEVIGGGILGVGGWERMR